MQHVASLHRLIALELNATQITYDGLKEIQGQFVLIFNYYVTFFVYNAKTKIAILMTFKCLFPTISHGAINFFLSYKHYILFFRYRF